MCPRTVNNVVHVTKTLLEAWRYIFDARDTDQARDDFMATLRREPTDANEAMMNGLAFEDRAYRLARGETVRSDAKWLEGAGKVANIIRGAQIQVLVTRPIEVDGTTYLLKGVLDALKAGVIYDVKFLSKSMNNFDVYGKWLNCTQHPAYFYLVPEAHEFQYLASDGEDIYIETYRRDETQYIGDIIHDFLMYLKAEGLTDLFMERWAV